jgi:hypothetical protein
MSSHKTAATVAHTIGIDTGKNTRHLIGLDDKGAIAICARSSCRAPALFCSDQQTGRSIALGCGSRSAAQRLHHNVLACALTSPPAPAAKRSAKAAAVHRSSCTSASAMTSRTGRRHCRRKQTNRSDTS